MASGMGMESVFGFPFQTMVEGKRGIKTEEQHLPGVMHCEGWEEEAPHAICGGNIRNILPQVSREDVKQEPGEGMLQRWDDQWQTFLKTMESPPLELGNPPSPEESVPWDNAQAFLAAFEQVAKACRWPKEEWTARLRPALQGDTEQAFEKMDARDRADYGKVKATILWRDAMQREEQRRDFRGFCYQAAKGPRMVYGRLQELGCRWLKAKRQTKEEILEDLILEQFLAILPLEMQSWVRDRGPGSSSQAVALAEDFLARHCKAERPEQQIPVKEVSLNFSVAEQIPLVCEHNPVFQEENAEIVHSLGQDQTSASNRDQPENDHGQASWIEMNSMKGGGSKHDVQEEDPQIWPAPKELQSSSLGEKVEKAIPYNGNELLCTSRQQRIQMVKSEGTSVGGNGSFPENSEIIEFQVTHSGGMSYKCLDCGKSFNYSTSLVRHQRIHTGEKPYNCLDCGKCFRQRSGLTIHQRIHTGEKAYQCLDCEKCFRVKSHLIRHSVVHQGETGEMPYRCSECGKGFRWNANLITHRKTHMGVKPFECAECGKSFYSNMRLVRHQRVHTGTNPYTCAICGKSFCDNTGLTRHQKIHTGEKPYICLDCGKSFNRNSSLISHQRIHTGAKPFQCRDCGKNFRSKSELHRHELSHVREISEKRLVGDISTSEQNWQQTGS